MIDLLLDDPGALSVAPGFWVRRVPLLVLPLGPLKYDRGGAP